MGTSISTTSDTSRGLGRRPLIGVRLLGALIAVSLAATAAALSYWLRLYWWDLGFAAPVALIGIGVGLVLGFISGPGAVTTRRPAIYALVVACKAALLGFAVLWALSFAAAASGSPSAGGPIVDGLAFAVFGVPSALAFALPVTVPIAFLATGVLRLWSRRPTSGRAAIAAVLWVGVLSTGVAIGVPRPDLTVDWADAAPVHVEWTVANRTARFLELGIFDREGDRSFGGSVAAIEPCFISTGRHPLDTDWFLTLDPHPEDGDPEELVRAAEAPGAEVRVLIEVAANGTASVEVGRAPPPVEEQTVDLCTEGADR